MIRALGAVAAMHTQTVRRRNARDTWDKAIHRVRAGRMGFYGLAPPAYPCCGGPGVQVIHMRQASQLSDVLQDYTEDFDTDGLHLAGAATGGPGRRRSSSGFSAADGGSGEADAADADAADWLRSDLEAILTQPEGVDFAQYRYDRILVAERRATSCPRGS